MEDILERVYLSADLEIPWCPPRRARGGDQGEGGLGLSTYGI